ncbi:hypothetical protein S7S_14875 [Isoalcanivorax pacificus W11-5]|uniref:DUF2231 domain-containing protein n=1 Tax=Isoalcanivorax pacificus W11-5 TaxID=391936 RepID=A0A0B4XSU6_9GAMM|nr:DUF2231 domain-containing protein [Isoalcanivorax pacificus]AJD49387.1 hypothetical protein S7S_14875 [Isoalcanivorax pacificus W11-5]
MSTPDTPHRPIPSRMAIGGHPLHPMLIHFPVAALLALVGTDTGYLLTEDPFWSRAGVWLAGVGAAGGWFSGIVGLIDLVSVRPIRRLVTAWCHALVAVMLLSLASFNWLLRISTDDHGAVIMPAGLVLTLLSAALTAAAGLLGGRLVYEHAVGVDVPVDTR